MTTSAPIWAECPRDCLEQEECVVRLGRRRWRKMDVHRVAGGDLQDERRRSAAVLHRRADAPRRWLAAEPHRRPHALALGAREKQLSVKPPAKGYRGPAFDHHVE